MANNTTLPGTGEVVEDIDIGAGVKRQVMTIGDRAGGSVDSIGGLTETAPATDTASSGLNGRLQRVAQRLTTLIGSTIAVAPVSGAASSALTVTRPANTTAYTANDAVGAAAAALDFASMGPSGAEIIITSAALEIDAAAIISGETSYLLHLYNVTPPSALADNAAFDLPSGDRASYLGFINLGAPQDLGSTLYCEVNGINKQVKLSGTDLFGYLVTVGAYTPTSARVHKVTLHAVPA